MELRQWKCKTNLKKMKILCKLKKLNYFYLFLFLFIHWFLFVLLMYLCIFYSFIYKYRLYHSVYNNLSFVDYAAPKISSYCACAAWGSSSCTRRGLITAHHLKYCGKIKLLRNSVSSVVQIPIKMCKRLRLVYMTAQKGHRHKYSASYRYLVRVFD